ncbi:hypothetical protein ACU4GD_20695 [Cupriavidus basilensis]
MQKTLWYGLLLVASMLAPMARGVSGACAQAAVLLRCSPAPSTCWSGLVPGCWSFGHAAFFGGAAVMPAGSCHESRWGVDAGSRNAVLATLAGALDRLRGLRGRWRSGARASTSPMITLALAQMLFSSVCLQAPATGGEDGLQAIPRGKLFGVLLAGRRPDALLRGAGRHRGPRLR